jgi:hypothetical protein
MAKDIGADSTEAFADIRMTSDNGFILVMSYSGISGYKTEASKGDRDYWIVKLNESGKFEWDKTLGGDSLTKPNLSYKPKMEVMLPLAGHSRICQEIKQKIKVLQDFGLLNSNCALKISGSQ